LPWGTQDQTYLGNLDAQRDWGHAKDYVEGMWRILQQDQPDDYVLATGVTTRVREFARLAFAAAGMELRFEGTGVDEKAFVDRVTNPAVKAEVGQLVISVDPRYFRPTEVELLIGDAKKAQEKLGWTPQTNLEQLVTEMVAEEFKSI
jgi:GDPmannose 4,6-dehydratase